MNVSLGDCDYCETVLSVLVVEHLRKEHPKFIAEVVVNGDIETEK